MVDPVAPPPEQVVTHASLEEILRSVLSDVVSEGALVKMVNYAVDNRVENMRTIISGIDQYQRNSFQDFKSAANDFRASNEKNQAVMGQLIERMARAETGQEADRRRISDIFKRVESQETELESLKDQIIRIENKTDNNRIDIHGDANQAQRPSIHSLLKSLETKLDGGFAGIQADMHIIKETQTRHEAYISRRQSIETWVFKTLKGMWQKQLTRWALLAGLPVIGTLFVAAADPKVAEGIAKFISLLLTGK